MITKEQASKAAGVILARLAKETCLMHAVSSIEADCARDVIIDVLTIGTEFSPSETVIDSLRVHLNTWFNRRESTKWSEKEIKALKKVAAMNTHPDDFVMLNAFYLSNDRFKRRDILTLLNNWNGEIDRAKAYKPARKGADDRQGRNEIIIPKVMK